MKININDKNVIQIEEIFNTIVLKSSNEEIYICMRDGGFEFSYNGDNYCIKEGLVYKLKNQETIEERKRAASFLLNDYLDDGLLNE